MKGIIKVKIVLAVFVFFACIDGLILKSVHAQHTDVFNLYQDKGPNNPNNLNKNDTDKDAEPGTPEVELIEVEIISSTKSRLKKVNTRQKILPWQILSYGRLWTKHHLSGIRSILFWRADIEEIHTRTFGKQGCIRKRKGNVFWLNDGRKCVYWTPWSTWDCRPEEERDDCCISLGV